MASRSIDSLSPELRGRAVAFLLECQRRGFEAMIYCTLRTLSEQAALYAVGRDLPGKVLTNAKPGDSLHNPDGDGWAWAFDAVPMMAGKPLWSDSQGLDAMGAAGESVGLQWAGRWRGPLRERLHFQMNGGRYA